MAVLRAFVSNKKVLNRTNRNKEKKKKCRNCYDLKLVAETALPGAFKFEIFILLLLQVFELKRFKH